MENISLDLPAIKSKGRTYEQYLDLIDQLLVKGMTTGEEQSQDRLAKAALNRQRMKRIDKTANLRPGLMKILGGISEEYIMLVLSEGWCGDASQSVPWLNQFAQHSNGRLTAVFLLRDENPEVMDLFLTAGSRSIPKVVIARKYDGKVVATWGPRPVRISEKWELMKKQVGLSKDEMATRLHKWYAEEKGAAIMDDFESVFSTLS